MDNKRVKAINERLAYYEREGKTNSKFYRETVAMIKASKIDTKSRKGTVRISRSKSILKNITDELLRKLDKKSSVKKATMQARKSLKEMGVKKPTKEQIEEFINDKDIVDAKMEDMLIEIYAKQSRGAELSEPETKLDKIMRKDGNGKYERWTYKEMANIIREQEEQEEIKKHTALEQIRAIDKYNK